MLEIKETNIQFSKPPPAPNLMTLGPHGGGKSTPFTLTADLLSEVWRGTHKFILYRRVEYKDIFSDRDIRHTEFTAQLILARDPGLPVMPDDRPSAGSIPNFTDFEFIGPQNTAR